jgi:hypothetical protein
MRYLITIALGCCIAASPLSDTKLVNLIIKITGG